MKVYIIQDKRFFKENQVDYQMADALQPVSVVSSQKKASELMKYYQKYYEERGYQRETKYNELFPIEHFQMINGNYRVVIQCNVEEVE